jgi:hypothetical protein
MATIAADEQVPPPTYDVGDRPEAYVAALVAIDWVVNIPCQRIDVYTRPSGPASAPAYENCQSFGPDDTVPVVLDGREVGRIAVRDVLP